MPLPTISAPQKQAPLSTHPSMAACHSYNDLITTPSQATAPTAPRTKRQTCHHASYGKVSRPPYYPFPPAATYANCISRKPAWQNKKRLWLCRRKNALIHTSTCKSISVRNRKRKSATSPAHTAPPNIRRTAHSPTPIHYPVLSRRL